MSDCRRFVHDLQGKCYILLEGMLSPGEEGEEGTVESRTPLENRTAAQSMLPLESSLSLEREEEQDSPPAYSEELGEECVNDASFVR